MDIPSTKLLTRERNNLQSLPKLLLLPTLFFLCAMVFMPEQTLINPLNFINSYYFSFSPANTSSNEMPTSINDTSSNISSSSSSFSSHCSANVSSELCSANDSSAATSTTEDDNDGIEISDGLQDSSLTSSSNSILFYPPEEYDIVSREDCKSSSQDYIISVDPPVIPTETTEITEDANANADESQSSANDPVNVDPPENPTNTGSSSSSSSSIDLSVDSSLEPSMGVASPNIMKVENTSASKNDAIKPSHSSPRIISVRIPRNCDMFQGEWVSDPDAPHYTNMTCSMIQEHQNCMKYGRPDMDFLKWRWKPHGCELSYFDPIRFLEIVRGKSMAFVGDSLARNHMQSLLCLLSKVEIPEDVDIPDERIKRWYYSKYKFTITIFWSPFLVQAQEMEKNGLWYIHLDKADNNWATRIQEFDYLIISASNWFTRPSMYFVRSRLDGCNYCYTKKITNRSLYYANKLAFQTVFNAINRDSSYKGLTILRTASPSHFENGPWNEGGNCNRTRPIKGNDTKFPASEHEMYKAQMEVFKVAKMEARKMRREIKMMDMTNAMLQRPDGHPNRYGHWPQEYVTTHNDCVHWCLPGPVDLWNQFLIQMVM